jgi:hypothetical protein
MQRHRATIKDVACEVGMDFSTVSPALRDHPRIPPLRGSASTRRRSASPPFPTGRPGPSVRADRYTESDLRDVRGLYAREVALVDGAPSPRLARSGDWRRGYAFYAKFGEAINVTDGRYTLFQWPPGEVNAPLYWYGCEPPGFLTPRGVGPYEPYEQRFPIDWVRGPIRTALYDVTVDPAQRHDLVNERPEIVQHLQAALRDWLRAVGAPAEQLQRLGLE